MGLFIFFAINYKHNVCIIYVYKYVTTYTSVCLNIYLSQPRRVYWVSPIGAIINNGEYMEPLKMVIIHDSHCLSQPHRNYSLHAGAVLQILLSFLSRIHTASVIMMIINCLIM